MIKRYECQWPIGTRLFGQYLLNWLNLLDHAGNCLLLGDADETMSARLARARNAGRRWAFWLCRALTWAQILLTAGRMRRDHGDYALDKRTRPNSREILDLCHWPPRLRRRPASEVRGIESKETRP